MANKRTKRFISVLLAAVMVVSSLPFTVFSAFAADIDASDPIITKAETAMHTYETKMDGTIYKNMASAYDAYVKLQEYVDIYKYTGTDKGISAQVTALTTATNQLTDENKFVSYTGDKYARVSKDSGSNTEENYRTLNKNLLYAPDVTTSPTYASTGQVTMKSDWNGSCYYFGYIFTSRGAVMLYDGVTAPQTIIAATYENNATGTWTTNTTELSCSIVQSTNNGMSLDAAWKGRAASKSNKDGYKDFMWAYFVGDNNTLSTDDTNTSNGYNQYRAANGTYTSAFKFTDKMGDDEYTRYCAPSFKFRGGLDAPPNTNNIKEGVATASDGSGVYVVNYATLLSAIDGTKNLIAHPENYTQGGLKALIAAIDAGTSFNPNDYDYATNTSGTVTTVGNDIKAKKEAIASAQASVTADSTNYATLGAALLDSQATYKRGNDDNAYTSDSWATFKDAYEAANNTIANLDTTGYTDANAALTQANALTSAKSGLVTQGKVNTADLEISISNALVAINNKDYFTAESWVSANLASLVQAAQVAVWGSVDNYGVDAEKIGDNAENVAIVKSHATAINEAVAKLVISPNSEYSVAGVSLTDAINNAQTYIDNGKDYANIATLVTAVTDANTYISTEIPVAIDASVSGTVSAKVNKYIEVILSITRAIKNLRASFSKMKDGTVVNEGSDTTTTLLHTHGNSAGAWGFWWKRKSDTTIIRTQFEASTYDLPDGTFEWFSTDKSSAYNFDAVLDSVSFLATETTANPEIHVANGNDNDAALTEADKKKYPAITSIKNGGISFTLTSVKLMTKGSAVNEIARDKEGNVTTDINTELLPYINEAKGVIPAAGLIVKKGTNTYAVKTTAAIDEDQPKRVNATTVPKIWGMDTSQANTYMSVLYCWKYQPFLQYLGYGYQCEPYTQKINIVDFATLMKLITDCENTDTYVQSKYTTDSWKTFTDAIGAAKNEMTYDGKSAEQIRAEGETRYTNLWNAKEALVEAANNDSLKAAITATQDTYKNSEADCDPTTWAAFSSAYQAAYAAYADQYSDLNVRNVAKADQDKIDALATALNDAYAALKFYADFTPVVNAATTLVQSLQDKVYTAASLKEVKERLAGMTYLNVAESDRHNYYKSATAADDSQAAINAEAEEIAAITATKGEFDASALLAQEDAIKSQYDDPDAWTGLNEALAAIENDWFEDVTLYQNYKVKGIKYTSQEDIDAAVTKIRTDTIKTHTYTVTLDGDTVGTFKYGEQITVDSISGKEVNWYYAYKSETASNDKKYLATDKSLTFIVKGDTALTTSAIKDSNTNNVKITFRNNLNGQVYGVDYAAQGSTYALDESTAPKYPNFTFAGWTDAEGKAITSLADIQGATTVYANYEYSSEDHYEVNLFALIRTKANDYIKISGLNYNDEISFLEDNLVGTTKVASNDVVIAVDTTSKDVKCEYRANSVVGTAQLVDGKITIPAASRVKSNGTDTQNNLNNIIGYVGLRGDDTAGLYDYYMQHAGPNMNLRLGFGEYDESGTLRKDENGNNMFKQNVVEVVSYGADYTFRVHKNEYLTPFTNHQMTNATAGSGFNSGIISDWGTVHTSAHVYGKADLVKGADKFSMISSYAIPAGCTAVESGVLFAATTDGTTPTADLRFDNVGTDGVARLKSSKHTQGNQFVISINTTGLTTGTTVNVRYAPYIIYKDADGNSHTMLLEEPIDTSITI